MLDGLTKAMPKKYVNTFYVFVINKGIDIFLRHLTLLSGSTLNVHSALNRLLFKIVPTAKTSVFVFLGYHIFFKCPLPDSTEAVI